MNIDDKTRRVTISPAADSVYEVETAGNAIKVRSGGNPNVLFVFETESEGVVNERSEPAIPGATIVRPWRKLYVVQPSAAKLLDEDLVFDIAVHGSAVVTAESPRGLHGAPHESGFEHLPAHKSATLAPGSVTLLDYDDIGAPFDRHYGYQWHSSPRKFIDGAIFVDKVTSNLVNTTWILTALTRCSFTADQGGTTETEMTFATMTGAVAGGAQDVAFYLGAPCWRYSVVSCYEVGTGTHVNDRLRVPIGGLKLVLTNADSVSGAYKSLIGFRDN